VTLALAALLAGTAHANDYRPAIAGCEAAIGTQLGLDSGDARFNLEKVKSRSRTREMSFVVTAFDDASPVQAVDVACVATHGGEVVSVTFPDGEYPNAVADK
jgi:hypothetical protein